MDIVKKTLIVVTCLLLIPVAAVATAAAKQRFADGPNRVFSGGPLESGDLHSGPEPDCHRDAARGSAAVAAHLDR